MPVVKLDPIYAAVPTMLNTATNSGSGTWLYVPQDASLLVGVVCGYSSGTDTYLDSGNYSFSVQGQSFTHLARSPQTNNSFDLAICYLTSPAITEPSGLEVPFSYNISSSMTDGYMIYLLAFKETSVTAPFASYNIIEAPSGDSGEVSGVTGTVDEDYLLMITLDSTGTGTTEGVSITTGGPSAKNGAMYLRVRGEVWGATTTPFYATNLGNNAALAALSIKYTPGNQAAWLTA